MDLPQEPAWLPDPSSRYQYRWWDGSTWTAEVSRDGVPMTDPEPILQPTVQQDYTIPDPAPPAPGLATGGPPAPGPQPIAGGPPPPAYGVPTTPDTPDRVTRQVAKAQRAAQAPATGGGGTIFSEPILVVNQKARFIEIASEFAVYNQNGDQVGAIREVGQSTLKKVFRVIGSYDQYMRKELDIVDMAGNVQLKVIRPAKFIKSKFEVVGPTGGLVGHIIQRNAIGKIRFGFEANGQEIGGIKAENWRAWNFRIEDQAGNEVARITKTWEGLVKTMFTTADNYVIHIHQQLTEPLRSLVIASALSVDTALKQDQRGCN